jgi:hypothetical protein
VYFLNTDTESADDSDADTSAMYGLVIHKAVQCIPERVKRRKANSDFTRLLKIANLRMRPPPLYALSPSWLTEIWKVRMTHRLWRRRLRFTRLDPFLAETLPIAFGKASA